MRLLAMMLEFIILLLRAAKDERATFKSHGARLHTLLDCRNIRILIGARPRTGLIILAGLHLLLLAGPHEIILVLYLLLHLHLLILRGQLSANIRYVGRDVESLEPCLAAPRIPLCRHRSLRGVFCEVGAVATLEIPLRFFEVGFVAEVRQAY